MTSPDPFVPRCRVFGWSRNLELTVVVRHSMSDHLPRGEHTGPSALGLLMWLVLGAQVVVAQSGPRALTQGPDSNRFPVFDPAGDRVAFESDREGSWDIDVLDLETGVVRSVVASSVDERMPTWSPDGSRLAFVRSSDEGSELAIIDLATAVVTPLLPGSGAQGEAVLFPDWSPDGRTIAWTRALGGEFAIEWHHLAPADGLRGTNSLEVPPLAGGRWPRWSPDGTQVVYFSRIDTSGRDDEIYVSRLGSEAQIRLTRREGHDFCPAWSPDGAHLVFVSVEPDGSRYLRVVDVGGRERARLASGWFRVTEPSWSPEGLIAYAARASSDEPYQIYAETAPPIVSPPDP